VAVADVTGTGIAEPDEEQHGLISSVAAILARIAATGAL
jgi:hypothetical protein